MRVLNMAKMPGAVGMEEGLTPAVQGLRSGPRGVLAICRGTEGKPSVLGAAPVAGVLACKTG